jgi:alanine dehydrogenase
VATATKSLVLLSGSDLQTLLEPKAVVEALQQVYRDLAAHPADGGKSLAFTIEGGSAHVKAGLLPGSHAALAAKINVNLPGNFERRQLPTIQGAVLLADTITGRPLALMDSMTLTAIRTAATAMLAAGFGARKDSKIAAIVGCGMQGRFQAAALTACFSLDEIRVFDANEMRARALAASVADDRTKATVVSSVSEAIADADICITCTTSTKPVLTSGMPLGGCFVAAVGADNPAKCEIEPALMARARILVDDIDQCAAGADLAHALQSGAVSRDNVHADLAELAAGSKRGREQPDELVIFDSSGSGVQDVAAAWLAYQIATSKGIGRTFEISS